jgi:hypothetical protein
VNVFFVFGDEEKKNNGSNSQKKKKLSIECLLLKSEGSNANDASTYKFIRHLP